MARYLIFHTEPEYHTLQNVLRLVEKFAVDGPAVDKLFAKTGDEDLLSAYKATIVVGDKTLQSIIATSRTALNLWNDKEVCKTTATNSIDFTMLRNQPVALYVCNPLKDLMYFKPLSALFFQSLFNYVLSRIPHKDERSIFFILDEAATMRFPNLSITVSNIRKFNAGILLCMQDEMALISQYGQAEAHQIKTNCGCQVYLKGQPLHTATELSKILGKYTYTKDDTPNVDRVRELMTPDEIRMCEDAIILINNQAPLRCKTVPYFKNIWLKKLADLPPVELGSRFVDEPALIPFSKS
jgi:type IV secretory pathway TraG/TraD family ATPase VirD4